MRLGGRQHTQEPAKQAEAPVVPPGLQKAAHALPDAFKAQAQAPSVRGLATMMSVASGATAVPDYDQSTVDLGIDLASKYGPETRLYHGTSMDAWGAVGDGLDLYATKNPMEALSYAYDAASRSWAAYMKAHGLESEDEIPSEVRHDRRAIVVTFQIKDVEGLELLGDDASDSLDFDSWEDSLDAVGSMCIRGNIQAIKPGLAILESGAVEAGEIAPPRRQIDTPEFKAWFGKSEVVGADGQPLVVHHATTAEFSSFDPNTSMWFSADREDAAEYVEGGRCIDCFLAIRNPADLDSKMVIGFLEAEQGDAEWVRFGSAELWNINEDILKVRAALIDYGFDGMKIRHGSGFDHYAAFYPTQIKSATGNSGAFSPTDPDICR